MNTEIDKSKDITTYHKFLPTIYRLIMMKNTNTIQRFENFSERRRVEVIHTSFLSQEMNKLV